MKRKIFSLTIALILCLNCGIGAFAQSGEFIFDFEDVVSDEQPLELKAQEIYDAFSVAVIYIRSKSLDGMTGAEYAQHMYSQYVSYPDAIVLVDCAEASSYFMHYAGSADQIFQPGDGKTMMIAFDEAGTFDEGIRDYLDTAEKILLQRQDTTRELVLLEDDSAPEYVTQSEEAPLLSLTDDPAEPQPIQTNPAIPEDRQLPLVVDTAGAMDPEAVQNLNAKAESISEKYKCEVAAVFVKSTGAYSAQAFADDFYDYNGYGYGTGDDGIIFMVAVEDRSFAISTYGSAGYSFTDYGQLYMDEKYLPHLKNSDWSAAADAYLDACAELLDYEQKNGVAYDVSYVEPESSILEGVVFSLIIGFVLGFIPVGIMKRKMLNVEKKRDAADYMRQGSFELKRRHDRYIRSQVTRTPIPKNNDDNRGGGSGGSTFHISSSGRTHGGHSGRF